MNVKAIQSAKTISLVRDGKSADEIELDQFKISFGRSLQESLSARNIIPRGEGGKAEKLAKMLGEPVEEVVQWLMGQGIPDARQLSKLSRVLNVPADVLINTSGPSGRQSGMIDEDYQCISLHDESSLSDGYNIYMLPETLRHMNLPRSTTIMTIHGDDMAPLYRPNDHVIYDPRVSSISTNGIYVLRLHGHPVIRRVQKVKNGVLRLICDNPAFTPVEHTIAEFTKNPETEDRIFVIGRVLGSIRIGAVV